MKLKKLIAFIIVFSMIFTNGLSTIFAATITGTTLELQKYTGDVSVSNTMGVELKTAVVSKLFSGYTITTKEGYAWISIDTDQVIKLDWNTQVTLKKSGTKTEILVDSGEILFMINEPLTSTASFTIRTSTMSTGVRGTIGHVEVGKSKDSSGNNKSVTKLSMLEGSVLMSTIHEKDVSSSGETTPETREVSASQEATAAASEQVGGAVATEVVEISVGETIQSNGFVAVEFKENEVFQERLEEDLTEDEKQTIIDTADDSQAEDETASQESAAEAESEAENTLTDLEDDDETTTDTNSDDAEESSTPSSSSSGSSSSGNNSSLISSECVVTYYYYVDDVTTKYATQTVPANTEFYAPVLQPTEYGSWFASTGDNASVFTGFESKIYGKTTLSLYWVTIDVS